MKQPLLVALFAALSVAGYASALGGQAITAAGSEDIVRASDARPAGREFRAIRDILGGKLLFSVVVATAGGCVGLMLLTAGLLPAQVARAEQALRRGPWKVVFIGVVGVVILLLCAAVLGNAGKAGAPVLGVLGLVVLGFLVWLGAIGLAATAKIAGRRLMGDDAGTQAPWRTVGAGALAIGAAALVPIFGAALFIFFLCRGVGAAALALFPPSEARPAPAESAPKGDDAGEA